MFKLCIISVILIQSYICFAQNEKKSEIKADTVLIQKQESLKNSIYFEFLGNCWIYSINYERVIIPIWKFSFGFRTGLCYLPIGNYFNLPILVNCIFKITRTVQAEFSIGKLLWEAMGFYTITNSFAFGVRLQGKKGLLFRLTYTPLINDMGTKPWMGISIGKSF